MDNAPLPIRVLWVLSTTANATNAEIANQLGSTPEMVKRAVRNLRDSYQAVTTVDRRSSITEAGREMLATRKYPKKAADRITAYSQAQPSKIRAAPRRPDWVPPAWTPTRPGADDHKQFKSRGIA